eukprot:7709469-Alexandrium_andersonii.AAC.1
MSRRTRRNSVESAAGEPPSVRVATLRLAGEAGGPPLCWGAAAVTDGLAEQGRALPAGEAPPGCPPAALP